MDSIDLVVGEVVAIFFLSIFPYGSFIGEWLDVKIRAQHPILQSKHKWILEAIRRISDTNSSC